MTERLALKPSLDGDGVQAAADGDEDLEDTELGGGGGGGGLVGEEEGRGGTGDAAADDADGGGGVVEGGEPGEVERRHRGSQEVVVSTPE